MKADIIVIGGGISGCAIFYELSRDKNKKVLLLESGDIAGATTGDSGGYVRKFNLDPYLQKLASESFDYYQNFSEHVGGSCDFQRTGLVSRVSWDILASLMPQIEDLQASGHGIVVSETPPINALKQPIYEKNDSAFIYEPTLGHINTKLTCRSWVQAACNNGADVFTNTLVEKILVRSNNIYGLQTTRGLIECEMVVLSAGAWSKQLLQPLPIDTSNISARSFQYNIYISAAKYLDIAFMDNIAGFYMAPFRNGNIFVGSLGQDALVVESQFNHEINQQLAEQLNSCLQKHFSWLNMVEKISAKRNYDAYTDDGYGVVKSFPELPNLILATGWSSGGIKSAPAVAQEVTRLVAGQPLLFGGIYANTTS